VADHFDLIAGTSTGGIIALALGLGMRPREILDFYLRLGPGVFRDRAGLRVVRRLARAKYATGPLEAALRQVFGERSLGESAKRLVIASYNLGADDVYLFRTAHHPRLARDWRERAVDVAMATSAAPTYLPCFPLSGSRLVDGGVWANNPAMIAVVEAAGTCGAALEALQVFSLGTTSEVRHRSRGLDHGGMLKWGRDAVDVILRAQSISASNQVRHPLEPERLLRLDPAVPPALMALDKVNAGDLIGWASHASRVAGPRFSEFLGHRAAPFVPSHGPGGPA